MTTTAPPEPTPTTGTPATDKTGGSSWVWAAMAGGVAAATALAVAELISGASTRIPSLLVAVANGVVEAGSGTPIKDIAIALFGTNEKTALVVGTVVLAVLFGAALGVAARRLSRAVGYAGLVAFALLGIASTSFSPLDSTTWAILPAFGAVISGALALRFLLNVDLAAAQRDLRAESGGRFGRGRRDFMRVTVGMTVLAGGLGALGRSFGARAQAALTRSAIDVPVADQLAGPLSEGTAFADVEGISPLITPNSDFYRIDTAVTVPSVDADSWTMAVRGMVDQEISLSLQDLLAMPQMEADVTIACVSNEVGGDLIGTARWQGVRLSDVLDMAGVDPDATQIVSRSVDGWDCGFPTEVAFDGRDAMIAVAMNGEPLPLEHGFPARMIVPGLYGYVSATKWLAEIELTTWEAFDGYWIPRGWSKEGPIKTQSRIDVPRSRSTVEAGQTWIAGVAWAQRRGLEKVEVQVDDEEWVQAELAEAISVDTWRQWRVRWDATPGSHTIRVRATDQDGFTQTEERVPVAPDGAEGFHTVGVTVA